MVENTNLKLPLNKFSKYIYFFNAMPIEIDLVLWCLVGLEFPDNVSLGFHLRLCLFLHFILNIIVTIKNFQINGK